jgi:hypothetical protein
MESLMFLKPAEAGDFISKIMKNRLYFALLWGIAIVLTSCSASFNAGRALQGTVKAISAASISDKQMQSYVHQYIVRLDAKSTVLPAESPYAVRLGKLVSGFTSVEGIPLNFKVYRNNEANAFACADGSVRVYSKLMDIMSDEEILGVIGHEIGHVALKHSKKAYQKALMTSALMDGIAAQGDVAAVLTDSQFGALGEAIMNASYSRKQETDADDYAYAFLKRSGKNPVSLALAFNKLKQMGGSASSHALVNNLLSTHPNLDSRIGRVLNRATADGYYKKK